MSKKTIILHAGHPKTGSSYIQTCLALNAGKLQSAGILYPEHSSFENALKGNITGGNCTPGNLARSIDDALSRRPEFERYLFSTEVIYEATLKGRLDLAPLREKGDLEIILFIRNPFEYAVSRYGQRIKGGSSSENLGDYLATRNPAHQLLGFINIVKDLGIKIHIANYSKCKNRVLEVFAEKLGLDAGFFEPPARATINRSLTRSELYLLRGFNRNIWQKLERSLSDPLCNQLPDVPSEPPFCSEADVEAFLEKSRQSVIDLNEVLPESERLAVQSVEDVRGLFSAVPDDIHCFSSDQIDVVTEAVGQLLNKANNKETDEDFAKIARDLAIKMEKASEFSTKDSLNLMRIANRLKPDGKFIKEKIQSYRKSMK